MVPYLEKLTIRLASGVGQWPDEDRRHVAGFLHGQQQPDGGFPGREGGSDLYYTSFALRSLAILGELHGETASRVAGFLSERMAGQESMVDFHSLIFSAALLESASGIDVFAEVPDDWCDRVSDQLEQLRRDDGGYARSPEGNASSTYHSFLILLVRQLIERDLPEPERLVEFLYGQQAPAGGFLEIRAGKRAGTNPTAAAIAALVILDALEDDAQVATAEFLGQMQTEEGGLRANTRIPIADLLSTFTGLLTLTDLDRTEMIDAAAVFRYARSLHHASGGFLGAAWDQQPDVEYTFYGVGSWALVAGELDRLSEPG